MSVVGARSDLVGKRSLLVWKGMHYEILNENGLQDEGLCLVIVI